MQPPKLALIQRPTPLWHHPALDALVGCEVWVKRDDMTEGAAGGNKARKLEYLLAAAQEHGATTVITCGGTQSNHARATAILARQIGMRSVLLLRDSQSEGPPMAAGNLLLDRMVGADVRFITPKQYVERDVRMVDVAHQLRTAGEIPYVIPEGGSNGLGALGYVDAMEEVRQQLDTTQGFDRFDAVVHACGSGGTAAGTALGCARWGIAPEVWPMAVCDDTAYFTETIRRIVDDAMTHAPALDRPVPVQVMDHGRGPAYGVASEAQVEFMFQVANRCGLILDPVYSGKAMFALAQRVRASQSVPARLLFIHTGGLPGLLAQADTLGRGFGTAAH